jgi:hypothetical protein
MPNHSAGESIFIDCADFHTSPYINSIVQSRTLRHIGRVECMPETDLFRIVMKKFHGKRPSGEERKTGGG